MNVTTTKTCQIYNKTLSNIDEVRCRIMSTAADLYYYDFGYICMGPISLIIVISIFSRIKGHYRWLILNQAIWDLILSSFYSCGLQEFDFVKKMPLCFYLPRTYANFTSNWVLNLDYFFRWIILYNSFSALLLLSISRFLALYYPHAYAKLIKGRRIVYAIISFNLFTLFFDICPLFLMLQSQRLSEINNECIIQKNITLIACRELQEDKDDFLYNFYSNCVVVFNVLQQSKPLIFLIPSMIAMMMIILKIVKQIIFQIKQDRKDFTGTIRITVVIALQNVMNCGVVFLETFSLFLPRIVATFKFKIILIRLFVPDRDDTGYLDLRIPLWIDGSYGLTSSYSIRTIIQLRIFIESFIVLVIMTGYREAIIDFIKYIYNNILRLPITALKNFKFISNKTIISNPSLF